MEVEMMNDLSMNTEGSEPSEENQIMKEKLQLENEAVKSEPTVNKSSLIDLLNTSTAFLEQP